MAKHSFYTPQFWLLCLGAVFFMAAFNMIIPELPDYITQLGGADYKGLIISLSTLSAGFSRPFSGRLTDNLGRKPVIIFGVLAGLFVSLGYLVVITVAGFLFLRFLHGFAMGFSPTGQTALLSDSIPVAKRGEALGIFGVASNLGMAGGPALGGALAEYYGLDTMFVVSAVLSLIATIIFLSMKETLKNPQKPAWGMLRITRADIYEPAVKGPAIVMILYTFSFGAILTLIPDFSHVLHIPNKGLYFTVYFLSSLLSRLVAGKVSDRFGRVLVLKAGLAVIFAGLVITAIAPGKLLFLTGAAFYGFGAGIASPAIFAWTVDLSRKHFRGRAISTMYLSLEIGIGVGALASGWIFGNNPHNLPLVFLICSALVFIAFLYLQFFEQNKKAVPVEL